MVLANPKYDNAVPAWSTSSQLSVTLPHLSAVPHCLVTLPHTASLECSVTLPHLSAVSHCLT